MKLAFLFGKARIRAERRPHTLFLWDLLPANSDVPILSEEGVDAEPRIKDLARRMRRGLTLGEAIAASGRTPV